MRAVRVRDFGGPEVLDLQHVPDPLAKPGEVLIKVTVSSVLWVETMIRRTGGRPHFNVEAPYIPGGGVGGTVVALGEGVDPEWLGRAVVGHTGGTGGYAELAVLPVEVLSVVPDGLPLSDAMALLHDGVTATAILDRLRVRTGDRVLVVGASGGLGIVSLQLGKARGASIIGTARDETKLARLSHLGTIVDSDAPDWIAKIRSEVGDVDVILDNVGGALGEAAFDLLATGGRFSAHGTPSGRFAALDAELVKDRDAEVIGIRDVQPTVAERRRLTDQVLAEAAAGTVQPLIGQTWPLERAAEAHAAIEARTVFGTTQLTQQPGRTARRL